MTKQTTQQTTQKKLDVMNKKQAIKKIAEYYYGGLWITAATSVEEIESDGAPLRNVYAEEFKSGGKLYFYMGLVFQVREQ